MDHIHHYQSPLGRLTLKSNGQALTGLCFDDTAKTDAKSAQKDLPIFNQADKWLDLYFSGTAPDFTPPIFINVTPFAKAVLEITLTVPFGQTTTYGKIASQIAKQKGIKKMSAQAVGGALKRNPISLIIPCHRVIASNGNLTGYAAGINKKIRLLKHEQSAQMPRSANLF